MRLFWTAAVVATLWAGVAASQAVERLQDVVERPFVANGRITMDLSAGDYRIVGGPDRRIRITWSARDRERYRKLDVRAEADGPRATVTTDGPVNNDFRATIDVPARTDLVIRLSAGELRIEGIEGDKDISQHAGEIDIDIGDPKSYRRVEASVWAGELHVQPFGATREGLFRSFDWNGNGRYRLNARLKAGELRLHAAR